MELKPYAYAYELPDGQQLLSNGRALVRTESLKDAVEVHLFKLDPSIDLVARGMRYEQNQALVKECAAQAGMNRRGDNSYEDWSSEGRNVCMRIANSAHAAGFAEAVQRILGIPNPQVIVSLVEAVDAAKAAVDLMDVPTTEAEQIHMRKMHGG